MLLHFINYYIIVMVLLTFSLAEIRQKRFPETVDAFFDTGSLDNVPESFENIPYSPLLGDSGDLEQKKFFVKREISSTERQRTKESKSIHEEDDENEDLNQISNEEVFKFGVEKLYQNTPEVNDQINEKISSLDEDLAELHNLVQMISVVKSKGVRRRRLQKRHRPHDDPNDCNNEVPKTIPLAEDFLYGPKDLPHDPEFFHGKQLTATPGCVTKTTPKATPPPPLTTTVRTTMKMFKTSKFTTCTPPLETTTKFTTIPPRTSTIPTTTTTEDVNTSPVNIVFRNTTRSHHIWPEGITQAKFEDESEEITTISSSPAKSEVSPKKSRSLRNLVDKEFVFHPHHNIRRVTSRAPYAVKGSLDPRYGDGGESLVSIPSNGVGEESYVLSNSELAKEQKSLHNRVEELDTIEKQLEKEVIPGTATFEPQSTLEALQITTLPPTTVKQIQQIQNPPPPDNTIKNSPADEKEEKLSEDEINDNSENTASNILKAFQILQQKSQLPKPAKEVLYPMHKTIRRMRKRNAAFEDAPSRFLYRRPKYFKTRKNFLHFRHEPSKFPVNNIVLYLNNEPYYFKKAPRPIEKKYKKAAAVCVPAKDVEPLPKKNVIEELTTTSYDKAKEENMEQMMEQSAPCDALQPTPVLDLDKWKRKDKSMLFPFARRIKEAPVVDHVEPSSEHTTSSTTEAGSFIINGAPAQDSYSQTTQVFTSESTILIPVTLFSTEIYIHLPTIRSNVLAEDGSIENYYLQQMYSTTPEDGAPDDTPHSEEAPQYDPPSAQSVSNCPTENTHRSTTLKNKPVKHRLDKYNNTEQPMEMQTEAISHGQRGDAKTMAQIESPEHHEEKPEHDEEKKTSEDDEEETEQHGEEKSDHDVEETKEDHGEDTKEHHGDESKEHHGEDTKEHHGDESKEHHGEETKEQHGEEMEHHDEKSEEHEEKSDHQEAETKEHHGEEKSEHHGEETKEHHGDEKSEHHGEETKEHHDEGKSEHHGEETKEHHGDEKSEHHGEETKEHHGEEKSEHHGEETKEHHGDEKSEHHGEETKEHHGEEKSEHHGEETKEHHGEEKSEHHGEETKEHHGDETSEHHGEETKEHHGEEKSEHHDEKSEEHEGKSDHHEAETKEHHGEEKSEHHEGETKEHHEEEKKHDEKSEEHEVKSDDHGGEAKEHHGEEKSEHHGEETKEHHGDETSEHHGEETKEHHGEEKSEHHGEKTEEHTEETKEHHGEEKEHHDTPTEQGTLESTKSDEQTSENDLLQVSTPHHVDDSEHENKNTNLPTEMTTTLVGAPSSDEIPFGVTESQLPMSTPAPMEKSEEGTTSSPEQLAEMEKNKANGTNTATNVTSISKTVQETTAQNGTSNITTPGVSGKAAAMSQEELYAEIPINNKNMELSTNCTNADYMAKNHCICSVSAMKKDLMDDIKDISTSTTYQYDCSKFIRIEPGIVIGNGSESKLVRKKRDPMDIFFESITLKEGARIGRDIETFLHQDVEVHSNGTVTFATVGSKITIPCGDVIQEDTTNMLFEWTVHNGAPETAGNKPNNGSTLVIESVVPQDTNNYTCKATDTSSHNVQSYTHELIVVALPMFSIMVTVLLKEEDKCNPGDLEVLNLYYSVALKNILCGSGDDICSVSIERPQCVKVGSQEVVSIRSTLQTVLIATMFPKLHLDTCDLSCQGRLYSAMAGVLLKNFASATNLAVFFRLSYRDTKLKPIQNELGDKKNTISNSILPICPPGFGIYTNAKLCFACNGYSYNPGNEMKCIACPTGSYQPSIGEGSCLPCNSPIDDTSCFLPDGIADMTRKYYLFPLIACACILLLICSCLCANFAKNRKNKTIAKLTKKISKLGQKQPNGKESAKKVPRKSSEKSLKSVKTESTEESVKKDTKKGKKIPPELPPIDF